MKILITAAGPTLDSPVDPRFGRSAYFIVVDPDTMEFEALKNPNDMATGGAGIQAAQMVAGMGVSHIITGAVGPNAGGVLSGTGIQVLQAGSGSVKDTVLAFKENRLQSIPTGGGYMPGGYGMGGFGRGWGYGRGMAAGFGRGYWRGMGWNMGGYYPGYNPGYSPPPLDKKGELELLKAQADMLKRQLEDIEKRIKELESL